LYQTDLKICEQFLQATLAREPSRKAFDFLQDCTRLLEFCAAYEIFVKVQENSPTSWHAVLESEQARIDAFPDTDFEAFFLDFIRHRDGYTVGSASFYTIDNF